MLQGSQFEFKLYYKAIVPKPAWYWHKKRRKDRFNTIGLEISPVRYFHLILNKVTENLHWQKDSLINK
jgi:hypothetical protein